VRGRLADLEAIGTARVALSSGSSVPLNSLARVVYAGREPDTTSRLDGQERVVLLVHAAGTANLIAFSRSMAEERRILAAQGITSRVILDEGRDLEATLWQTIRALLEGLAIVLLVVPLLLPRGRHIAAIALLLPLALVVTTAMLAALRVVVDRFVLAGFAVGLGTVLDFAILITRSNRAAFEDLLPSLATALVTTLFFLAPLAFLDFVWPGIRNLVLAVGLLLVTSFGLSAFFLPVLRGPVDAPPVRALVRARVLVGRFGGAARRGVGRLVVWSSRHPKRVLATSAALALGAVAAVIGAGVDLGQALEGHEISAHVEFESEASLASVDERTAGLVREVRGLTGVTTVQSLARPGSAELTVGWDHARTTRATLTSALVAAGGRVEGAFVYIPTGAGAHTIPVQVVLSGDDNGRLRDLAKQASRALSGSAVVEQVVLNFKDPPRQLVLRFDHAKTVRAGLAPAEAASALRWNLYGPVALKWIDRDRERDLRVMGPRGRALTRSELVNLPLVGSQGTVKVSALSRLVETAGGAKIYHENRQRVVYLTVQTSLGSARAITQSLGAALVQVDWPPGYTFRIDPRLAEQEAHFGWVAVSLVLSLLLIGLLLGARSQSFGVPPLTLAMVPVALAFPVVGAALMGGFTVPVLLGLVLLSGTIVNNAILIVDAARHRPLGSVYGVLRRRLTPLAMTNLTAVLGSLPLAMVGESGSILPTLSVLVVWGAAGALLTTLTTVPALLTRFSRALDPWSPASGGHHDSNFPVSRIPRDGSAGVERPKGR